MMTLEQARANLQSVVDQLRLTKEERDTLNTSLGLLYGRAIDHDEEQEDAKNG
jgi:hypothetical protein